MGFFLTDAANWVVEKAEDAGEWLGDQAQDALNSAQKVFTDGLEDLENLMNDPLGTAVTLLFERPWEIYGDTAMLPWDKIVYANGAEFAQLLTDYGEAFLETLQEGHRRSREFFNKYIPQPHVWVDEFLQEESYDYAYLKGVFEKGVDAAHALQQIPLEVLMQTPFLFAGVLQCGVANLLFGDDRYRSKIEAIIAGSEQMQDIKVARLPSSDKYFIWSDLHMYARGNLDTMQLQRVKDLAVRVLNHYARNRFHFIENGDVEDYWLEGGSIYGHAYGTANGYSSPLDSAINEDMLQQACELHLEAIHENNKAIYDTIESQFRHPRRYTRTFGNHDDVYQHQHMVTALNNIYPGIDVYEYIILEHQGTPIGLIAHGHQTDSWNSEACTYTGKAVTSVFSLLRDVGFGAWRPFMKDEAATEALFSTSDNTFNDVTEVLGLSSDLGSLDEVDLFHVFQEITGLQRNDTQDVVNRPYLFLGHTHAPLAEPWHPTGPARWRTYVNSGCCIFNEAITGIEWDGTTDPLNPTITLVAFRGRAGLERVILQPGADPWLYATAPQRIR